MDYLVIDFETATSKNNSACSLGMVFVSGKKIMHEKYFLIRPPDLKVDPVNLKIHGLTTEILKDAPTFDFVWKEISHFFHEHCLLVAHNARFDFGVLKSCLTEYNINEPNFNYFCSIPFSGKVTSGSGIGKSLKDRAEYFGIEIDNHHNALSDAKTCAQLIIKSMELKNKKTVDAYLATYNTIPVKSFSKLKVEENFSKNTKFKNKSIRITDLTPNTEVISVSHPLFGKTLVFTGELRTMDRNEAMQKAVDLGAFVRSSVSGKTDFLVLGEQDHQIVGLGDPSGKEQKALEIIENGGKVKIINENEYLLML